MFQLEQIFHHLAIVMVSLYLSNFYLSLLDSLFSFVQNLMFVLNDPLDLIFLVVKFSFHSPDVILKEIKDIREIITIIIPTF